MLTDPEHRAEAERLLSLNAHGIAVERLAMALRFGAASDFAANELKRLDMEFLNGILEGNDDESAGHGGEIEGEAPPE